jgi:Na+/H+ antiporter NhaD/arsenite permease-like protein
MTGTVVAIFAIVYVGMILGGITAQAVQALAGNLLIVGSIANIIVVDAARRHGSAIDWRARARAGVPVTAATLSITAAWFAWRVAAAPG